MPFVLPSTVYTIGVVAKTRDHPLYGIGDANCLSVNGEFGNITVTEGDTIALQASQLSADYAVYLTDSKVGGGERPLSPRVAGADILVWTIKLAIASEQKPLKFAGQASLLFVGSALFNLTTANDTGAQTEKTSVTDNATSRSGSPSLSLTSATLDEDTVRTSSPRSPLSRGSVVLDPRPLSIRASMIRPIAFEPPTEAAQSGTPAAMVYLQAANRLSAGFPVIILRA